MKACWCSALAAAAFAAAMGSAVAQTAAAPASAAASAPRSAGAADKAVPRRPTPAELRDSATPPGDLRPEDRVTPQIVIPLRKGAARRPAGAASGTIDDTAARCEAQSSPQARERCRAAGKR